MINAWANRLSVKRIFGIDAAGALLTATLLFLLWAPHPEWLGIPESALLVLGSIACTFFLYSASCALNTSEKWRLYLGIISVLNMAYVVLVFGLLLAHSSQITALGWLILMGEAFIILILASVEMKKAWSKNPTKLNRNDN